MQGNIQFYMHNNPTEEMMPTAVKDAEGWVSIIVSMAYKRNPQDSKLSFDEYHTKDNITKDSVRYAGNGLIPPKYIYHTSLKKNREFIKENGLIPIENKQWSIELDYPAVVFTSMDKNDLFDLDENRDVYKIDTTGLDNMWYQDLNLNTLNNYVHDKYIMTFKEIPKENITMVSEI